MYLDTHNALPKPITNDPSENDNPTNDVIIPCRFPQRLNVAQLSLGSLEIPLAQYNIEKEWQTLYFDEGIDLYVMDPSQESLVQFSIQENMNVYTAQLPPRLNPVIDINPLGPTTSAVFTTQYPHMLDLRGFFNFGEESMKLIDTPLSDPAYLNITNLTTSNAALTILSDTQFQLTWAGPVTFNANPSGVLGYVSTPSIPSPVYLADLVTQALNLVIPGHWSVTYNPCNGKYKLCYVGLTCELQDLSPATLLIPGNNSLPHIMGFGCINVNIPLPFTETKNLSIFDQTRPREPIVQPNNCIESIECSPCRSQIQIDEGNYSPESLMNNLARQLNRFYFDPGCNLSANVPPGPVTTSNPVNFVYSTHCGLCFTLQIPFGLYTPDTFAAFLQSQMIANIPSITVTWNLDSGQFIFSANEDFGLEFDVGTTELAFRMGFYPICHRNNNSYSSTIPFYYPTKGCCGTTIPFRHLSYVYSPLLNSNQRKFIIEVCKTRCINNVGPIVDNGDGTITITTQLQLVPLINLAHGYQVLDVVEITVGGQTYQLTVTRVDSYNQFTVDLGSIPAAVFVGNPTCICLSNSITTNLYFSCVDNDVFAQTLGYTNKCDALWNPTVPTTWIPPACFMLDWPQYVLVELTEPNGATRNMHIWDEDATHTDTLTRILAKVILYPQFRMERSFPFQMYLPDLRIINRVQVRILNPNHSLYRFHGKNWSFTLNFTAIEKSINQLCY